jgi:hypothetical protein
MKKKFETTAIIVVSFLVMLACSIGYEGVAIGDDPEDYDRYLMSLTIEAMNSESVPQAAAATSEPVYQAASQQGADPSTVEAAVNGTHEYSVEAANFECTCQVDGNMTVSFNFTGDQVEVTNAGGDGQVYDKAGENSYKRTFMGYYILDSGSGDQVTSTVVEEERSVVIILNHTGYRMEHFQGAASSPCCYHTFTKQK